MYIIDLDLLGLKQDSAILGASILHFDTSLSIDKDPNVLYDTFVNDTKYIKFSVQDQKENYNRTIDQNTFKYWKSLTPDIQDIAFVPKKSDKPFKEGLLQLSEFYSKTKGNDFIFVRGFHDHNIILSAFDYAEIKPPFISFQFRELNTAIDLTKNTANKGKCDIPGFERKSLPIAKYQCALDALMLMLGD